MLITNEKDSVLSVKKSLSSAYLVLLLKFLIEIMKFLSNLLYFARLVIGLVNGFVRFMLDKVCGFVEHVVLHFIFTNVALHRCYLFDNESDKGNGIFTKQNFFVSLFNECELGSNYYVYVRYVWREDLNECIGSGEKKHGNDDVVYDKNVSDFLVLPGFNVSNIKGRESFNRRTDSYWYIVQCGLKDNSDWMNEHNSGLPDFVEVVFLKVPFCCDFYLVEKNFPVWFNRNC